MAICRAQGGFAEPPIAPLTHSITANAAGSLSAIDNRVLARIAKLAGAPGAKAAGVDLHVKLHERIEVGQPMFTIHAETSGELSYALAFANANPDVFSLRAI